MNLGIKEWMEMDVFKKRSVRTLGLKKIGQP